MQLVYVGNNKFIIISLYANNKSVRLDKDHPYTFEVTDLLNEDAIRYYESLKSQGVELVGEKDKCSDGSDPVDTPVINPDWDKEDDESCTDDSLDDEVQSQDEDSTPEIDVPSDVTSEELIEYLDLNYDDESIKDLARSAGVSRIMGSWDKMTIINKILETNTNYVVNLVRS